MSDTAEPKLKKRKGLSIVIILTVLLVLAVAILALLPGSHPQRSLLDDLLGRKPLEVTVDEFLFDVGRNRVFAHSNGSIAAAGTLGIQVLGPDGRETLRDSYRSTTPALAERNGRFIAFDIGGGTVRVFNNQKVLYSIETEDAVVSASVNANGWFCIVTQTQTGGSKGTVDIYNNKGIQVFQVTMQSGYVLCAKLSDNNKDLSILSLTETGSRVTAYLGIDEEKDEPDRLYTLGGSVFIDIEYTDSSNLIIFGTGSVVSINLSKDTKKELCSFDEKRLGSYTITERFFALCLYDYNIGYSGQLVVYDFEGKVLGQMSTSLEITSMSSYADTLMLLHSEGIVFYDTYLEAYPPSGSSIYATTAGSVLALNARTALTANDLSAVIVKRG